MQKSTPVLSLFCLFVCMESSQIRLHKLHSTKDAFHRKTWSINKLQRDEKNFKEFMTFECNFHIVIHIIGLEKHLSCVSRAMYTMHRSIFVVVVVVFAGRWHRFQNTLRIGRDSGATLLQYVAISMYAERRKWQNCKQIKPYKSWYLWQKLWWNSKPSNCIQ